MLVSIFVAIILDYFNEAQSDLLISVKWDDIEVTIYLVSRRLLLMTAGTFHRSPSSASPSPPSPHSRS